MPDVHFKAVQLDPVSRQRTGREYQLIAATRQQAIDELLGQLGLSPAEARVDPTRSMLQTSTQLWALIARSTPPSSATESPALRRAGAKHKTVR